ncbi:MAG: DUF5666 domain-containing protein [Anaerolineales bacterium]
MKEYYEAFESCLEAMENGDSLDTCLERYPDLAGELRPLLETAQAARSIADDSIPNSAFHRSRSRILGKASQLRAQREPKQFIFGRVPRMAMVALALALIFFMSWRGVIETARALPGDPFYSVKRSAQNIRIQIAPNPDTKRAIEVKYERQRVDEVMRLLRMGRITQVTFEGLLNERTSDRWIIEGIPVIVTPDTQIAGEIEEARVVEVTGKTQSDGVIEASQINGGIVVAMRYCAGIVLCGFGGVFGHVEAVLIEPADVVLCCRIALCGGFHVPGVSLLIVLFYAEPAFVHEADISQCAQLTVACGLIEPETCLLVIFLDAGAGLEAVAQLFLGGMVAGIGI